MKTKTLVLTLFAITAGVFAFNRANNVPPSDLRDAVADNKGGSAEAFNTAIPEFKKNDASLPIPQPEKVEAFQGQRFELRNLAGAAVTVDNGSRLMWVTNPENAGIGGKYAWNGAREACENLAYAGFSDWRLPKDTELLNIIDAKRAGPAVDPKYFANTHDYYWTAAIMPQADTALQVNFYDAKKSEAKKTSSDYIRCVRADSAAGKAASAGLAAAGKDVKGAGAAGAGEAAKGGIALASGADQRRAAEVPALSAQAASTVKKVSKTDVPSGVLATGAIAGNVGAGVQFVNAMSLGDQALALGQTATNMGAQATQLGKTAAQLAQQAQAAAAAGDLAAAQRLGQQAAEIGNQAKALGQQAQATGEAAKAKGATALKTANRAVVMTAVSGGIMVLDGAWNIYKGITNGEKVEDALKISNSTLSASMSPEAMAAAQKEKARLEKEGDKAKKLVIVGGIKISAGAMQLGSLGLAVTTAPYLAAAGAVVYLGAVIYQHWDDIEDAAKSVYNWFKTAPPPADQAQQEVQFQNLP